MRRFAFTCTALLAASGPALAQSGGCGDIRDFRFAPGASAGEVRGGVPRGGIDCYAIGMRAGQRLDAGITSVERNAVFQIYLPGWRDTPGDGVRDRAVRVRHPPDGNPTGTDRTDHPSRTKRVRHG